MKFLKGFLNIAVGVVFTLVAVLLALISFSVLVYPTNAYVAVIISLALVFIAMFFLNKLRRKLFKLAHKQIPLNAIITTAVLAVVMVAIFWIPAKTFESTGTTVAGYGFEPEYITIHTGDEIAVYVHKPAASNGQDPILFVVGGPGGYPSHSTKLYLDEYAKLGYTVYTYDPIGCGKSPLPKETSAYSMTHEVEVINDIMKHYNMEQVNLIASSYGGNVVARFIEQYPAQVNAYLSVDTAPIYSMEVNYPGQGNDMDFMNTVEDVRRNPLVAEPAQITDYTSPRELARFLYGMNLMKLMGKNDIPYGSYEEYDYMISLIVSTATNSFTEGGKPTRHMNFLSNILNTASLESSPDFTENLKGKNTPPVLVVQPEFGIVPWQIHYQYGEYFDNVKFVTAPKSGHDVWKTEIGKDILVRNGDALFRGEVIPDEYTSTENPFPPTSDGAKK